MRSLSWLQSWFTTSDYAWDQLLGSKETIRQPHRLSVLQLEDRIVPSGRPLPYPVIAVAPGEGAGLVKLIDAENGEPLLNLVPFEEAFRGGVRVALGDLSGDGYPEVITGAGGGGGPRVRIYDGKSGEQIPGPLGNFYAYDPSFHGGIFVAAGDVTGDKIDDVVTTADVGGGPHVRVFDGKTGSEIASFFVFEESFRGGASAAVKDVTGDGRAELILAAGPGGGPRIRVLDGVTFQTIDGPVGDFYAFDHNDRGGVNVAGGDVTGDGTPDIVAGQGKDHDPLVRVFDGKTGTQTWETMAFDTQGQGGVRVGTSFIDDDAYAEVVVGTTKGADPRVRSFNGRTGEQLAGPVGDFDPGVGSKGSGVNLAAGNDPPLPIVKIALSSGSWASEDGISGPYGLWVSRDVVDASALNVSVEVLGGTASSSDYTMSDSVTIPAWQEMVFLVIDPVDDTEPEP